MQKDISNEHGLPIFDVQGTDNIDNTSKRYPEQRFYLFIFLREKDFCLLLLICENFKQVSSSTCS